MLSTKLCHFDICVIVLLNLFSTSWHFKQFEIEFLKTVVKKNHNKKESLVQILKNAVTRKQSRCQLHIFRSVHRNYCGFR